MRHTAETTKRHWPLWAALAVIVLIGLCAPDDPVSPLTYHQGDAP
jgi:hypothetical protein